jgi:hypothetical protein
MSSEGEPRPEQHDAGLFYDRHRPLLDRRVPVDAIVLGRAYVIHARNGGIGVAVSSRGRLVYRLHREKFGEHFLFDEWDWAEGKPYGTAIPLRLLEVEPPLDPEALLDWLAERETECREEIDAAWAAVLRRPMGD